MSSRLVQPPVNVPMFVPGSQTLDPVWVLFLTSLVGDAAPIETITLDGSPFAYTVSFPGNVLISGGTVTNLSLQRARVTIDPLPMTSGFIPVMLGDIITVTYSVAPDMWFIPIMGGAGGN